MATAYEHLVTLLTSKFEVPPADVRGEATLTEIGLDSLAAAELHVSLQDEWQAHHEEGEITERMTVHQAAAVLAQWMSGKDLRQTEPSP